jgi:hypothetical protein
MKEKEFYQRAIDDGSFRRHQLEDLRYIKLVSAWIAGISGVLFAGQTLWHGLTDGAWMSGLDSFGVWAFLVMSHALVASRLGALEAIDRAVPSRAS